MGETGTNTVTVPVSINAVTVMEINPVREGVYDIKTFPFEGEVRSIDEIQLPAMIILDADSDPDLEKCDENARMLVAFLYERERVYAEWLSEHDTWLAEHPEDAAKHTKWVCAHPDWIAAHFEWLSKQPDWVNYCAAWKADGRPTKAKRRRHNSKGVMDLAEVPPWILSPLDPLHRNFAHIMDDDECTHIEIRSSKSEEDNGFKIAVKSEAGESSIYGAIEGDITSISLEDRNMARMLYAIIYRSLEEKLLAGTARNDIESYTVRVPIRDLGNSIMGEHRGKGFTRQEINKMIERIERFERITGVLRSRQDPKAVDRLRFLQWQRYNEATQTLTFGSPFLAVLSRQVLIDAGVLDADGQPRFAKRRQPQLLKANSYLVKSTILRQRNKRAIEMVRIICNTIEANNGSHEPSITAYNIIKQVDGFMDYLNNTSGVNRTKRLRTTFEKAFELLRTETFLQVVYPGIKLPKPDDYPTWSYLKSKRYFFSHNGIDNAAYAEIQRGNNASADNKP